MDPNRRIAKKAEKPQKKSKQLLARQAAFNPPSDKYRNGHHVPGSQNRNK